MLAELLDLINGPSVKAAFVRLGLLQGLPHNAVELAENALRLNPFPPGFP
jgi:hypothetical protein